MMKVFIAEDSALLRKELVMTTPWLDLGCTVVGEARDGEEAEQLIRKCLPDIVITDICMPKKDGLSLIQSLSDLADIHYIVLSAYNKFDYAQRAIKLQVKDYLLKPICDEEFHGTIQRVVQQRATAPKSMRPPLAVSPRDQRMTEILAYIGRNHALNITLADIARAHYISESYVSKLFRKQMNMSFTEYVNYIRIQRAAKLLSLPAHYLVAQVAQMVGYDDYRYFCQLFKKTMGMTPKQYQLTRRKKEED